MTVHTIYQGEDCILRIFDLTTNDDAGVEQPFDPTGCTIHAMARPDATSSTLWTEWSTSPTGAQGTASIVGQEIHLIVPHAMSSVWTWTRQTGVLQVEATKPGVGRARVWSGRIYLDPEAVR